LNLNLQSTDRALEPTLAAADVVMSDGGTGNLATITDGTTQFAEGWSGSLPTPVVSGDTAVYPGVQPGIDLTVQAQTAGFEMSYRVNTPPGDQVVLDVPLALKGLSATVDDSAQLVVSDRSCEQVAAAGTAMMVAAPSDPNTW